MRNIAYAGSGIRCVCWLQVVAGVALCLVGTIARADTINVGVLSYDTFIPAGNGCTT
jgi:hypothetical protein